MGIDRKFSQTASHCKHRQWRARPTPLQAIDLAAFRR